LLKRNCTFLRIFTDNVFETDREKKLNLRYPEVQEWLKAITVVATRVLACCYTVCTEPLLADLCVAESENGAVHLVTVTVTDEDQRLCYLALSHTTAGFFLSCPQHRNGYEVF
jgi:hypothetical protein